MMVCGWDSLSQATVFSLDWEVEGYRKCESGAVFVKLVIEMWGSSCEGWVGLDLESRERVSGELRIYR